MALPTISAGDLMGKGVTGTPAYPELSVGDLQAKFDELSIDVIVPKIQALVTALENASAGEDLGVTAPTGITASNKVKSVLDAMAVILLEIKVKSDGDYDNLVTLLAGITSVSNVVDGLATTVPTAKAITDFIQEIGGGDMLRVIYDADLDGIVDNSERLGGELPSHYATQQDLADELVNINTELAATAKQAYVDTLFANIGNIKTYMGTLTLYSSLPSTYGLSDRGKYFYVSETGYQSNYCWSYDENTNTGSWNNIGNNVNLGDNSVSKSMLQSNVVSSFNTDFINGKYQFLNHSLWVSGELWNYSSGIIIATNATMSRYPKTRVLAGTTYILSWCRPYFCILIYDDGTYQRLASTDTNFVFNVTLTPTKNGYLYLSAIGDNVTYPTSAIMMVNDTVLPSTYTNYGCYEISIPKLLLSKENNSCVIVDKNGEGDYSTIANAIANVVDGDTIIVMPGTYVEQVDAQGKEISIIGINKKKCILKSSANTYATPPIENACGYIANMTIYAEKLEGATAPEGTPPANWTPYAVHIDWEYSANKKLEYFNCDIISDWNWGAGVGLKAGFELIFNKCLLQSTAPTSGGLYFHDSSTVKGDQYIKVIDCIIRGATAAIWVYSLGYTDNRVYMTFIRNSVYTNNNKHTSASIQKTVTTAGTGFGGTNNFFLTADSFGNSIAELNA